MHIDLKSYGQRCHEEIWDHIVVNVSGGKDSAVLMAWAIENFPKEKIVCVHAVIDIDWSVTLPVLREQCKHMDLPLVEVQAIHADGRKKGFLSQLTSPRVNRKTGEVGQYKFPDQGNRWCTSMLKVAPIDKHIRKLKGNILCVLGERREESSQRAKLEEYRPDEKMSVNGRRIVKFSPILDMRVNQVWDVIEYYEIPKHPCYSWGVSRASCAICIFSSNEEIKIAYDKDPKIVEAYMEAESKIEHTFKYRAATKRRGEVKERISDILGLTDVERTDNQLTLFDCL
jgi:3'-phosphoadenosine 5'-phosphosulfate sulfotransferase (PAPS reductase)/FAD synthetase